MIRTEPARGMRDFLPEDIKRREHVIGVIKRVYERYGYEPLETPAVENLETLLGKYGDEGNQLIFKILKRGEHEASGQADLALRYDLTVPLARVIAHHQAKLPRLFKRYQIQPVWRADRPARGRFREFYQCDVDALGSTSPVIEAEQCSALAEALSALGFSDFTIRLNHRQLLTGLLSAASIPEALQPGALVAIDKIDKIGVDGVQEELQSRSIAPAAAAELLRLFDDVRRAFVGGTGGGHWNFVTEAGSPIHAAASNLQEITKLTNGTPAEGHLAFDPALARGLSYYTGAIMEINVPDLAGSLGGGGRYDDLVGMFLGQTVPACGFSLGLERILVVMGERGMFPPSLQTAPADVMVTVLDAVDAPEGLRVAGVLRNAGLRVLMYPEADKIGKQIKYADSRGIPCVAILGGDEIAAGRVTVKYLAAKTQNTYDQHESGRAIATALEELRRRG
jgi:histidyl-tRNA synthetase